MKKFLIIPFLLFLIGAVHLTNLIQFENHARIITPSVTTVVFPYASYIEDGVFQYETADLSDIFDSGGSNVRQSWKFNQASGNKENEQTGHTMVGSGSIDYQIDYIPDWFTGYDAAIQTDANGEGFSVAGHDDFDLDRPWSIAVLVKYNPRTPSELFNVSAFESSSDYYQGKSQTYGVHSMAVSGAYKDMNHISVKPYDTSYHLWISGLASDGKQYMYIDGVETYNSESISTGIDDPDLYIAEFDATAYAGAYCNDCEFVAMSIIDSAPADIDLNKALPKTIDSVNTDDFMTLTMTTDSVGTIKASGDNQFHNFLAGTGRKIYYDGAWGVAHEGEVQNQILQSEDFGTTWATSNLTVATEQTFDPYNATTHADKLTDSDAVNAGYVYQTIAHDAVNALQASTEYNFSVYIKQGTTSCESGDQMTLYFYDDSTSTEADCNVTSDWTQCYVNHTVQAGDGGGENTGFRIYACDKDDATDGTASPNIYMFGAQVVEGDHSPIGYTATKISATKKEDSKYTFDYTSINIDIDYLSMCWFQLPWDTSLDEDNGVLQFDNTDTFRLYGSHSSGKLNIQTGGLTDDMSSTCDSCTVTSRTYDQYCVFINQTDSKIYWYQNGSYVETDTDSFTANGSYHATTATIGGLGTNYRMFDGLISDVKFFTSTDSDPLTESEMASIADAHMTASCAEQSYSNCPQEIT